MALKDGISEDLKAFLRTHISSVEQLEILLHMLKVAPQAQNAVQLAESLYISAESATTRLESFADSGLLRKYETQPPTYSYQPRKAEDVRAVQDLATCYRERRVAVINFIFSNPISTIQSFADAFIIGKKKE